MHGQVRHGKVPVLGQLQHQPVLVRQDAEVQLMLELALILLSLRLGPSICTHGQLHGRLRLLCICVLCHRACAGCLLLR